MNSTEQAKQFIELFSEVYKYYHQTWDSKKEMPTAEASAIMLHLTRTGPLTISESAKHFKRSLSAMSEIYTRMIAQGWLEKKCNPQDKRTKYIWISKKGEKALKKASSALDFERVACAMEKLNYKQIQNVLKGLSDLINVGGNNEM